jgi:hypothetical protein
MSAVRHEAPLRHIILHLLYVYVIIHVVIMCWSFYFLNIIEWKEIYLFLSVLLSENQLKRVWFGIYLTGITLQYFLCLSKARTWISITKCHDLFCVQRFKVRGGHPHVIHVLAEMLTITN